MADTAVLIPPWFVAVIDAHPDDDTPRLILADWLDEHGEHALALGWRATAGRVPHLWRSECHAAAAHPWTWYADWAYDPGDAGLGAATLPPGGHASLRESAPESGAGWLAYPTPFAALDALARTPEAR
jgi:uncharacterized protein (TIGR02996 family)